MPRVDIHPAAAAQRGIHEGSQVHLLRNGARITMQAHFDEHLDPGVVVAEYGWWQGAPDIGAPAYEIGGKTDASYNSLAKSDWLDPISGAPAVRSMCCDLRAVDDHGVRWQGFRPLRVIDVTTLAPGVTSLTLAYEDATPLAGFTAGQFISLRLPGDEAGQLSRSYSIIGKPENSPATYKIAIRHVEDGALSKRLGTSKPGDLLHSSAPDGQFTLPVENEFPVVLIAAGIGITPFMSLLEQVASGGGPEIHLYYGSRNGEEHLFKDRIDAICAANNRITVRNFYSRPRSEDIHHHAPGRLTPDHLDPDLFHRRARFYMCGPDNMLDTFRSTLSERGVPAFEVFHERFSSPSRAAASDLRPRGVHFLRQKRTVRWTPADGSLLDLAERHNLSLPSGCRTGQCESCAVNVRSGKVGHYTQVETDEPGQCLACQAYPLSDVHLDA